MKKGYITVYLSLVTGVLLSLLLTVIEGVRMHTIRMQTECVMDMAMDSALAEYHRGLLDQYDLFFIDMSYGGASPSFENTGEHIRNYMNMNFRPSEIPLGKDLTCMQADRVEILQASVATDGNGMVLKRQAVDYVRDCLGLNILNRAAAHAEAIRGSGYLESDVQARRSAAEEEVKSAIRRKQEEEEEDWEGRNVELPSDVVDQARGEGILSLALPNPGALSRTPVPVETLLSHRGSRIVGTGLAEGKETPEGLMDRVLFLRYIMEKCGSFGSLKGGASFSYQVEYILEGRESDQENLRRTANRLLMLREAANVAWLFGDSAKRGEARETAVFLSSLLGLPELEAPVEALILFAWAYAESVKDLRMLFDGEKVPLVKSAESWNTPYRHLLTFRGHLSEYRRGQEGWSWQNYLEAFLYLQPEEQTIIRLMDVMEADIRMTPGNGRFRMDGCMDAMTAEAEVSGGYGYHYRIRRAYRYE